MPPNQQTNYDFILNSPQQPKNSFNLGGGGMKARIAVIAVIVLILIIVISVISSLLSGGSKAQTEQLLNIAQAQNEIIRVSALADEGAKSINTRNFAVTASLSTESAQQEVKKALVNRGLKEKSLNKQLATATNAKTDAALEEATQNNRFDETFVALMKQQLTDYQKLLQAAAGGSTPKTKEVLQTAFTSAAVLVPIQDAVGGGTNDGESSSSSKFTDEESDIFNDNAEQPVTDGLE